MQSMRVFVVFLELTVELGLLLLLSSCFRALGTFLLSRFRAGPGPEAHLHRGPTCFVSRSPSLPDPAAPSRDTQTSTLLS